MADLQAIFARAQAQVDQAVLTAGTTVRIADVDVDTADDLEQTETVENARTEPAILTMLGAAEIQAVPSLAVKVGDWRLVFRSGIVLPDVGQHVLVETCRDPRRVGDHGKVLGHVTDSSGAHTQVFVRPAPPTVSA